MSAFAVKRVNSTLDKYLSENNNIAATILSFSEFPKIAKLLLALLVKV
jgi:hypothetical protein